MISRENRIFIAGHKGLVGSACVRQFSERGFSTILTATKSELDLTRQSDVRAFFADHKPQVVIMAAGKVGGIQGNLDKPADLITQNLQIQLNLMEASQTFPVNKFLYFGSSCMYPRECTQPMKEDALLTGIPEPTSLPYAMAKLTGIQLCLAYNRQYRFTRYVPLIPNNIYGPGDDFDSDGAHVLPSLIRRFHAAKEDKAESVTLWGTGTPRREFVFSDDVADACLYFLEHEIGTANLPMNLGGGRDYSIREIAEMVARLVGFRGTLVFDASRPDGSPRKLLDSSRSHTLGWSPKVSLEDGLKRTYDWFVKERYGIQF